VGISRKLALISCFLLMLSSLIFTCNLLQDKLYASATSRLPGVAANQFLRYELSTYWMSGNDTEYKSTLTFLFLWYNITVVGVSGSQVTLHWTTSNYTTVLADETVVFDVESDEVMNYTTPAGFFPAFIASNLNTGDLVYNRTGWNGVINGTSTITVLGTSITTDYLNDYSASTQHMGSTPYNFSNIGEYYWEKTTGVLAEHIEDQYTNRSTSNGILVSWVELKIQILSAVPMIPESPLFIILPLFMLTTLLVVIAYKRKLLVTNENPSNQRQ
jgi:hypothetical protein